MSKYPTPPSNPLKPKPTTRKKSIDFSPEEPSSKRRRISKAVRGEVPKPRSGPSYSRMDRDLREMPKQIMGSTKAQRAASTLELMNDMRSRNILRAKIAKKKRDK